ncbi:MAG: hypothetical protein COA45_07985 [Zetaproteobacteria bacterium]|nr:MAG: hypothetical protein COA45_07985 [Zetaproteobacteria bacterium]
MKTKHVWADDALTQEISKQYCEIVGATDQYGEDINLYKVTQKDGLLTSEDFYLASEVPFSRQEVTNAQGETVEQAHVELKHVFGQNIRPAPLGSNKSYSVTSSSNGDLGLALKGQKEWTAPRLENGKMTVSVAEQSLTL